MEKITKEVLDENKELIIAGCVVGAVIVGGLACYYLCKYTYKQAYFKGTVDGLHGGIKWFDANFEGLELREKFDLWEKLNPDKMVYKA